MASPEIFESEQKYDVDAATPLPAPVDIPGVERVADPVARNLEKSAQRLQRILGDHQDSVMARALLTRFAAGPGLPPDTAGTYARLLEIEEGVAVDTEAGYRKAVKKKALDIRLR
jgi:hypothetical protein